MAGRALVIGVAGGSGSGKTTVADAIVRRVGRDRVLSIHQDRYYRDLSELDEASRQRTNFDHPDAIEDELLVEHLDRLTAGDRVELPVYDFARHLRTGRTDIAEPRPVILVEGILILAVAKVRERLDLKLYVDTDADLRFIRRLQRDTEQRGRSVRSVVDQWLDTVRPMHLEFVEPSKRYADLIIPEGGFNTVALDVLASRIDQRLRQDERRGFSSSRRAADDDDADGAPLP
ncbi:MAG: uridine kinase [Holophagae bacterium]|jgi:uridine kinase